MAQDVDTSSYKTAEGPSPLDIASKYGSMEQQKIGIDQSKLKLMNDRHQILIKNLSDLTSDPEVMAGGPNAPDKVRQEGQKLVNLGIIPSNMFGEFVKQIPTDPKQIPQYIQHLIGKAKSIDEAVNYHFGVPGMTNNGQTDQPIVTSPKFGIRSSGAPIQRNIPPTAEAIDPATNRPTFVGPQPTQAAPGAVTAPPMRQDLQQPQNRLPAAAPPDAAPLSFNDRFKPTGPATGLPPMFEEGKKQLAQDQQTALENFSSIQPVIKAYHMLDGLRSGPGTQQWNNALAFFKANNIIPTDLNDKTAIYQEVQKYLNQRIQASGTRSDAQLAGAEISNPNVGKQISPALINLTKNAIVMDRARALVPLAFEGNDYSKYGEHRAKFATQLDQKALAIDLMKPKERDALITDMVKKEKTLEGKRFWNTIRLLDKHQLVDTSTPTE